MKQLLFCLTVLTAFAFCQNGVAEETNDLSVLPPSPERAALEIDHFPNKMYAFIWRNWNLIPIEQMAKVLQTEPANIREVAQLMGLPEYQKPVWSIAQIYITILRRNWHILPYSQLLTLLDMSAEKLAFNLKEDDFLYIKLGSIKPKCDPITYKQPTAEEKKRLASIAKIIAMEFGELRQSVPEDPRFRFIDDLKQVDPNWKKKESIKSRFDIRYLHSYFALFGDPLADDKAELYPDGLLQKLADHGVNGVWLHVVLRDLVPGGTMFPEFGKGHEKRVANLRKLVNRAKTFGVDIYLYMNEPRAMPDTFFEKHPDIKGAPWRLNMSAMCTSCPEVRKWLGDSLAWLFKEVPGLGGIFSITASENFTSCASHGEGLMKKCPRCSKRTYAEIIAEVNTVFEEGVHRTAPDAKVIVWDWGWKGNVPSPEIIEKLPKKVFLMSVSEWSLPLQRGGIETVVGEYSISAVGPGPRAQAQWKSALSTGHRTAAKVQLNTTWEIGSVPYIPAMNLVAQHCHNLAESGVTAVMMGWSLGGYPSMNLSIPQIFDRDPLPSVDTALDELAQRLYGDGAALAREGWTVLSNGFKEFPYASSSIVYLAPIQIGPANFLYLKPTDYSATMVGIPYDKINAWRGPYPPEIFANQFEKAGRGFLQGANLLEKATRKAPAANRKEAADQTRYARTIGVVYSSVANQTRFVLLRDELNNTKTAPARKTEIKAEMSKIVRDEIQLSKSLYRLCREDSRIGFESTNHYWFVPSDLEEKVISCYHLLEQLK